MPDYTIDVTVDDGEAGMVGDEISENISGEECGSTGDKSVSEERSANEKSKVDGDEAKGVVDESVHDSGDDIASAARVSAGEVMGADECKCAAYRALVPRRLMVQLLLLWIWCTTLRVTRLAKVPLQEVLLARGSVLMRALGRLQ